MKTKTFQLFILLVIISGMTPYSVFAQKKSDKSKTQIIKLFNGKDLNNWAFYLKDPKVNSASVFTIKGKVIHITGNPFGYMRTKESFSNYKLHVEWRWPNEATNSGVFVHGQLPDAIWLKCFECQLMTGNAGDFVCMNGADMKELTSKSKIIIKKLAASSEKPVGKWNTMEVICEGNNIQVMVNGILQNKGSGLSITNGYICLQSEGKDIEFRKVYLTRLTK
jgi:hypothetical protein